MTDTSTLRALLARVEAATGPDRETDYRLWFMADGREFTPDLVGCIEAGDAMHSNCPAYTASIDAAVGLTERTLPRWRWLVHNPRSGVSYGASLSDPAPGGVVSVSQMGTLSASLALLAALLKAMIARADAGETE